MAPKKTAKRELRFIETHWFYAVLVLIVGFGLFVNHVLPGNSHHVLGTTTGISATELLNETNEQRALDHEQPLTLNPLLTQAATTKAENMVQLNYWSHDTPSGQTPWSFITAAGYKYDSAGENLAYGFTTAPSLMSAWMTSPDHKANILDSKYTQVGFGIIDANYYQGQNQVVLVDAMYGQPVGVTAAVAATGKTLPTIKNFNSLPASASVSRLQLFTGSNSAWLELVIVAAASSLLTFMAVKHVLKWRRVLVYSEQFVVDHPFFDISIMVFAMFTIATMHSVGYIG